MKKLASLLTINGLVPTYGIYRLIQASVGRDGQDHHLLVILKIKIRSNKKRDLEDHRSDHPNSVILKIKITIVILKIKITLLLYS